MDALIALAIKNKQTLTSPLSGMLGYLIKRQIIAIRGKQTVSFRRGNGKHGQTSKYFCDATPRRPLIRITCLFVHQSGTRRNGRHPSRSDPFPTFDRLPESIPKTKSTSVSGSLFSLFHPSDDSFSLPFFRSSHPPSKISSFPP